MTERENRHQVRVPARLRDARQWHDVHIRNVSSHGIMLLIDNPPPRGTYIEVRYGNSVAVGRVMWVEPGRCGLRTKERISIAGVAFAGGRKDERSGFRAAHARLHHPDATAARSAMIGRILQFAAALVIILAAGSIVALTSHDMLARPGKAIAQALG
jgi:hypothetical protein